MDVTLDTLFLYFFFPFFTSTFAGSSIAMGNIFEEGQSPTVHTSLNPFDHLVPRNYVKLLFYVPLKSEVSYQEAFVVLQEGLRQTFIQLPWLNGKAYWQSKDQPGWRPGQLEIQHQNKEPDMHPYQLHYNELHTETTWEELEESGFPIDAFEDEDLLWKEFLPSMENGTEVFVAQANFIPGGCLICAAVFHSVTDGMGDALLIKLWADNCKSVPDTEPKKTDAEVAMIRRAFDRKLLDEAFNDESPTPKEIAADTEKWELIDVNPKDKEAILKLPVGSDCKGGPRPAPDRIMKSCSFYVSEDDWKTLREMCTDSNNGAQVSGTDALYAFIWRCAMRARTAAKPSGSTDNAISRIELAIDCRSEISTRANFPGMYLGNCVLHNVVPMKVPDLIASNDEIPLSVIAAEIRNRAAKFTPDAIGDAYKLTKHVADFRELRLRFTYTEGDDMMISSALMFPNRQVLFGDKAFKNGGRPSAIRPTMGGFNRFFRMSFILPKLDSGGAEFVVSLYPDEMDKLLGDPEFKQYATLC